MTQIPPQDVRSLPPHSAALVEKILAENPVHRKALEAGLKGLDHHEVARLERYIGFCLSRGATIDYLADSYLLIVVDTLREQIYFQQHGRYRYASFAEVAGHVYFDKEYMSHYMHGLALTAFFWPNHQSLMSFFQDTLPRDKGGKYLEIGPGHGFFFMTAMEIAAFDEFEGIDISETSVAMTREILDFYQAGKDRKAEIVLKDFLLADIAPGSCAAVIMGEVLEHVERPEVFLGRIAEVAAPGAYIYITTCCNAPAVDHISLFRNFGEVEKLFVDASLALESSMILPMPGQTMETCEAKKLPVNVGYVLRKP